MTRRRPTPADVVRQQFGLLRKAVRNLLVDNKNFVSQAPGKRAYYYETYPQTPDFVAGPLRSAAQHILETVDATETLAVDMAASPDLPGFSRSLQGTVDGCAIRATSRDDGRWDLSFSHVHAFTGDGDWSGTVEGEEEANEAIRRYLAEGRYPEAATEPAP